MIYEERQAAFNEINVLMSQMSEPETDLRRQNRNVLGCLIAFPLFLLFRCVPIDIPFYIEILAALLLGFSFAQWKFVKEPKPKTHQEELDLALSKYEPADAEAFRSLQADTISSGRLRKEAYYKWISQEEYALAAEAGITAPKWDFATQR